MGDDKAKARSEYFAQYYEVNRESLSQKRKEKYENDPEYRERAKQAAKRRRKRLKKEREELRAKGLLPSSDRRTGPREPVEVLIGDSRMLAYTITVAAQKVGRSPDTLNYWAKKGLLPQTPVRSPRGERLYTDGMILIIKSAVMKRGEVSAKDGMFRQEILEGWRQLGLPV